MGGKYDVTIDQGATWQLVVTWTDSAGDAVNLTGYTAVATVKSTYGGTTILTASTAGGTITLGGVAGTITINVPYATTGALTPSKTAVWDLELTSGGGVRTRLLEGAAVITPEVTTT